MPPYNPWFIKTDVLLTALKTKLETKRNTAAQIVANPNKPPRQQLLIELEKNKAEQVKKFADAIQHHFQQYTTILKGGGAAPKVEGKTTQSEGSGEL